jgi:hypothetical protein
MSAPGTTLKFLLIEANDSELAVGTEWNEKGDNTGPIWAHGRRQGNLMGLAVTNGISTRTLSISIHGPSTMRGILYDAFGEHKASFRRQD